MAKAAAKKKPIKQSKPIKKAKPMAKKPAKRTVVKAAAKAAKKKPVAKQPAKKPVKAPAKPVKQAAKPQSKIQTKAAAKPAFAPKPFPKGKGKPLITKETTSTTGGVPPKRSKSTYKPVKLPAGYKPTDKEEYMNPQQLEYFRQKLLAWRKELIDESRETLDHLHEEEWHQADIADRASLETEAGVELRTRNRYLKLIAKIDAALRRVEEGEYGYCEETGEPIGLKRLEARPVATLSIDAQERHEKHERQVADEE